MHEPVERRSRDRQRCLRIRVHVTRPSVHVCHVCIPEQQRTVQSRGEDREELCGRVLGLAHRAQERVVWPKQVRLLQGQQAQIQRQPQHLRKDGPRTVCRLQRHLSPVSQQSSDSTQGPRLMHERAHASRQCALTVSQTQTLGDERRTPVASHVIAPSIDRHLVLHACRPVYPTDDP